MDKLNLMNAALSAHNTSADCSGLKKVNLFLDHEFITGFTLMIGAGVCSDQGCNHWQAGAGSQRKAVMTMTIVVFCKNQTLTRG